MSDPARPNGVPEAAWWSASDNEWILGAKDAAGRLQGEVTYWRPDGSRVCTCDHVDGEPHGVSHRFHETGEVAQRCHFVRGRLHGLRAWWMTDGATTEKPRADGIATTVWRGELDYDRGTVIALRLFTRDGVDAAPPPELAPRRRHLPWWPRPYRVVGGDTCDVTSVTRRRRRPAD